MRDIVGFTLMFIGMCLVALCNAIWYQGKLVLQRKDLPVSFFSNYFWDFRMMDKAISEEMPPSCDPKANESHLGSLPNWSRDGSRWPRP